MLPAGVTMRPATPGDRDFLRALYATTRDEEMALVPWTDEEKQAFLDMQFAAQDVGYRDAYPGGGSAVVEADGQPVGRLFTVELPGEVRIVDIALLPEYRGRGIGTALVGEVLTGAAARRLPVTLHVEPWNPARRLYERLGFRTVEERGVHEFMEWRPDA